MAWDVDASIVLQESPFAGDSSFMSERGFDTFIPKLLLSSGFLDLRMNFVGHGHNECLEVRGLEDDDVTVIILSLVMVVAARQ